MAIVIEVEGGKFDLTPGLEVQINETNPIFNDMGSMSVPVTLPPTSRNMRLSGWANKLISGVDVNNPRQRCRVSCGSWQRSGVVNYVSGSDIDGITLNIGFDNSSAYAEWRNRSLRDVAQRVGARREFGSMNLLKAYMNTLYTSANSQRDPYAVFPIVVAKGDDGYYEKLNEVSGGHLNWPATVKRTINGTLTDVDVPEGYGVTPFVRVWYVLDLIFRDLGCTVTHNPFLADRDLSRLVVLNNVADSCCRPNFFEDIDLMPDVSVDAFLNSLYVRFGLVYLVRENTAEIRLVRDVIDVAQSLDDLTRWATSRPTVHYGTPKYIALHSARSIEGAEAYKDRWPDFIRDKATRRIFHWGGLNNEYPTFSPSVSLVHDCMTGRWWWSLSTLSDMTNGTYKIDYSSSFFDFDPKTEGVEAMSLESEDEWVSLQYVGRGVSDCQPHYLVGSRHYHTTVRDNEKADDDESKISTPIGFMLAYTGVTGAVGTVGRFWRYAFGGAITFQDQSEAPAEVSLLYEFKGGLFDRFWSGFDELMRHSARSVEVSLRMPKHVLSAISVLRPYRFGNLRCLVDKLEYSLTSGPSVDVKATLRVIQPQGDYDITAEQGVADIGQS